MLDTYLQICSDNPPISWKYVESAMVICRCPRMRRPKPLFCFKYYGNFQKASLHLTVFLFLYNNACKGVTKQMNGCFCNSSGDVILSDRTLERTQVEFIAFLGWKKIITRWVLPCFQILAQNLFKRGRKRYNLLTAIFHLYKPYCCFIKISVRHLNIDNRAGPVDSSHEIIDGRPCSPFNPAVGLRLFKKPPQLIEQVQ